MMKLIAVLLLVVFTTFTTSDPDNLQDICVADLASAIIVNGFPCKPATTVTAADFSSKILATPGATTNTTFGSSVTAAQCSKNPRTKHTWCVISQLDVGFITTANVLISKTIVKGEIFVFPKGLVHFQKNSGYGPASVISAFNSQLQGTVNIALTLFAATPPVADQVLAQTFKASIQEIQRTKASFAPRN
ncbi:rhicadhesin receptor [Trifolium repens]|nr:rhicadhesin receptor [Trifolium repens]KAK2364881.1 rhicadhesin receptor [Trifolium repens]